MNIAFVGIGLIGGSLALSLRRVGFAAHLTGVESNPQHAHQALQLGLVDTIQPLPTAVSGADMVILAVPVHIARQLLPTIFDNLLPSAVVVDMGSTKDGICTQFRNHPKRSQFVASHPMAGTEYSGPQAAVDHLFEDKKAIVCEPQYSANEAIEWVVSMYHNIGTQVLFYESAAAHDKHVAYVSHLSHISSFMLGKTVLEVEKDEQHILELASTGFASTVRLAKSSPDTWTPIFLQNAALLSSALQTYIENLQQFKKYIDAADTQKLHQMMSEANQIGKIIDP
ncbi:prephenate dehydrogenase [Bacteroidia bacterium]|nr:prephenate dehydrogenase [Bacteroidia bacterium]